MSDISLEGVGFTYPGGVVALEDVNLEIPAGQALALVGANGSGKSTLVRHLDGLLRPTSGRVLIDGQDAATLTVAQLARRVGLCFQHPDRQLFHGQVRAEVEFGPRRLGRSETEVYKAVDAALRAVGLQDVRLHHPHDLGEAGRKLLSIASVLAMATPVVVLDEPTIGLDSHGLELIGRVVADLREAGRTVIVVSHDMDFVAESCKRIVVLDTGHVVLDGSLGAVFAEEAWPRLRAAGLEPPAASVAGARLGLGSTPTEAALVEAMAARQQHP